MQLIFPAVLLLAAAGTTTAQADKFENKFNALRAKEADTAHLTPTEMDLYNEMMAGRDVSHCGCTNNDPHIFTYDGAHSDCMGKGDYVYSKSHDSDFEVQLRFSTKSLKSRFNAFTGEENLPQFQGTSTKGGVVQTGYVNEPRIEAFGGNDQNSAKNLAQCEMQWFFDGVKQANLGKNNGIEDLGWGIFWRSGEKRYIFMRESGIWLEYEKWYWETWGCNMNLCVCPPAKLRSEEIVGLLGSPDGNKDNDFMKADGTVITNKPKSVAEQTQYCHDNWCVADNADNLFQHPVNRCDSAVTNTDSSLDEAIKNVSQEIKELCLFDRDCIVDTLVTGDTSFGTRTLEGEETTSEHKVDPNRNPEDAVEGDFVNGLPVERFEGNKDCTAFGYDYGFQLEGCTETSGDFISDVLDLTTLKMEATCDASVNPGSFELSCSEPTNEAGTKFKKATITPNVDMSVKLKGLTAGGILYKELKAGQTYSLDSGNEGKRIENIEFCFKCDDLQDENCPEDIKTCDGGSFVTRIAPACDFKACPVCPADTFTCEDGSVKSRILPACDFSECPIPEVVGEDECETDTMTCPDGSLVSRVAPDCDFTDCPTPDADNEVTTKAFTKGDPHFMTFGNEMYDYHGECDLVLLKNPLFKNGLGMEIHIRTKINDWWSAVETAAVKIGDEVLEITGGGLEKFLWINGKENEVMEENKFYKSTLSGLTVRSRRSGIVTEAHIYFGDNSEKLIIKTFKDFVRVDIEWQGSKHYEGSTGLLGSLELNGSRVARDGVTHIANHNAFGQEWQVKEDEAKLFHSYVGAVEAPNKCVLPLSGEDTAAKKNLRKRRLAESGLTMDAIEKACGHLTSESERKGCEYDVVATQDISMASVW